MEKDKNLPPLPGSAYKSNDNISCVHNPSYAKILILPSRAYREIDRSFAWQPPAACYICGTVFDFPLSDETLVQLLWFNLRQNMSIGQSGQDPLSSLPVDFMPSLLPLLATCTPDICVLHEQDANPEQWPKPMFENIPSRLIVLRDKLEEIVEDPITSAVWEYTVEQARKSDGLVPRVMPSQPIGYGLSQSGGYYGLRGLRLVTACLLHMFDEPEDWNSHANYLQCDWEQFVMTYLAPDAIHFLVREDFQGKKTSTEVFGIIASTSTTGVFIHPDEESTYQQDLLLAKKFCSRYD